MRIDGRTLSHDISETIREMAVRRVNEGEAPSSVIKSYGLCRTTIYKWLTAERRGGTAALKARTLSGDQVQGVLTGNTLVGYDEAGPFWMYFPSLGTIWGRSSTSTTSTTLS